MTLMRLERRNEALFVCEQFVRRLADLQTKPEAETTRLIKTIKEYEGAKPLPKLQKPKPRGPLVGRAEQLTRVRTCWKASVAGQAGVALGHGEDTVCRRGYRASGPGGRGVGCHRPRHAR